MTDAQRIKNLASPQGKIDAVLDTDAYNEIDDQFAISYMLKNPERINVKALFAAPFHNSRSDGPKDGMEKSYHEIGRLLSLIGLDVPTYRGSESYLPSEKTPIDSPAARELVRLAKEYSPEKPLYVVAIGAITNVASALLFSPEIAENIVVVWLGGHAYHYHDTKEFNLRQDIAAARVVFSSGAPVVLLPCFGVVSAFTVSKPELEYWLVGKTPLSDYLAKNSIEEADAYAFGKPWTRVIWDVTAVAWLLNDGGRFMEERFEDKRLPSYDALYEEPSGLLKLKYVYHINRDALMSDLFKKILS